MGQRVCRYASEKEKKDKKDKKTKKADAPGAAPGPGPSMAPGMSGMAPSKPDGSMGRVVCVALNDAHWSALYVRTNDVALFRLRPIAVRVCGADPRHGAR
jgi:hypothetical protein